MGGVAFTQNQANALTNIIIPGIQADLEASLNGRAIEPVQVREVCRIDDNGYALPKRTPINYIVGAKDTLGVDLAITAPVVVAAQTPLAGINLVSDEATLMIPEYAHKIYVGMTGNARCLLEYITGVFDAQTTASLKNGCMRVIAREINNTMDNSVGLRQGSEEVNAPPQIEIGWTEDELKKFRRLRRVSIL